MVECSCLLCMFILHEYNQFHSEGLKWHVGYNLSTHALKEGWKTHTCNKISSKKPELQCGGGLIRRGTFLFKLLSCRFNNFCPEDGNNRFL